MNKSTLEINNSKHSYTEPSKADVLSMMISDSALYISEPSLSTRDIDEIAKDIARLAKEVSELEPEELQQTYHLSFDEWKSENSEAIDDIYERHMDESDDMTREELEEMVFTAENRNAGLYSEIVWSIPLV